MAAISRTQRFPFTWPQAMLAALLVAAAAGISRLLAFSGGTMSLFWPVAGLGLSLLYLWGWWGLLPLALGLVGWAALAYGHTPWILPWILLAAMTGPTLVWLSTRALFSAHRQPFHRTQCTARFLRAQMLIGAPVAAAVGTGVLLFFGQIPLPGGEIDLVTLLSWWAVYWMIEVCGALLVAPVAWDVLVASRGQPWADRMAQQWQALAAHPVQLLLVPLVGVSVGAAFALTAAENARAFLYLLMPLLLVVAHTSSPRATHLHLMVIGMLVSASTAFALQAPQLTGGADAIELILLTLFLTVSGAVVLMLVASDEERRLALQRLERQAFSDPYTGLANEAGLQRAYTARLQAPSAPAPVLLIQLRLANWQAIEQLQSTTALLKLEVAAAQSLLNLRPEVHWARVGPGRFIGLGSDGATGPEQLAALVKLLSDPLAAGGTSGPDDPKGFETPSGHAPLWIPGEAITQNADALVRPRWRASALNCGQDGDLPALGVVLGRLREADQMSKASATPPMLHVRREDGERLRQAAESLEYVRQQILQRQLVLHAQPIVPNDVASSQGIKCEVLVRLRNRAGDILHPGQFLPQAMQGGLMQLLDQAVMEQTLTWFARRPQALARLEQCSINLSGQTLSNPDLAEWISHAFRQHGLPASKFTFEITESQAIAQPLEAAQSMADVRRLGCRVAIDDFGTGHATFDYIKRFQVDSIKIDGSFISELDQQPLDRVIVRSMVEVARLLNVRTVAEFVDSPEIQRWTRELGIDDCQGYALGRPQALESLFEPVLSGTIQ
jgi:EAL domain-containing protein (putative c-di-GMP-specific phosphodiesterase class I)/integral membrane sensor domain MASE1